MHHPYRTGALGRANLPMWSRFWSTYKYKIVLGEGAKMEENFQER